MTLSTVSLLFYGLIIFGVIGEKVATIGNPTEEGVSKIFFSVSSEIF